MIRPLIGMIAPGEAAIGEPERLIVGCAVNFEDRVEVLLVCHICHAPPGLPPHIQRHAPRNLAAALRGNLLSSSQYTAHGGVGRQSSGVALASDAIQ